MRPACRTLSGRCGRRGWPDNRREVSTVASWNRRTEAEAAMVAELIREGAGRAEVAEELGRNPKTVSDLAASVGLRFRYGPAPDASLRAAYMALVSGGHWSLGQLARARGVSVRAAGKVVGGLIRDGLLERVGGRLAVTRKWRDYRGRR